MIILGGTAEAQELTGMRCEVVDTKSNRGGRYATAPGYVMAHTSGCGKILYKVSTRENNVDGLAANFEPGPYISTGPATSFREGLMSVAQFVVSSSLDAFPSCSSKP